MEESQQGSTMILCDKKLIIFMIKNLIFYSKTKHVSIKYHFLQVISNKEIKFEYCKVKEQLEDILWKRFHESSSRHYEINLEYQLSALRNSVKLLMQLKKIKRPILENTINYKLVLS
jgi:hypothetical protein